MKNLQNLKEKGRKFWRAYGRYVFCGLSLVIAVVVGIFMFCNWCVFWLSLAVSATLLIRLPLSNAKIEDNFINVGWSSINFALYTASCYFCCIHTAVIDYYTLGIVVAIIPCSLIYHYAPRLSNYMGNVKYYGHNDTELGFVIFLVATIINSCIEIKFRNDKLFEQEPYVKVLNWHTEIYQGYTTYVVSTPKGTIGIQPCNYPQIREINPNTRIRVLLEGGTHPLGTANYCRLEIKNH